METLRGCLIVSCQALPGEPLHGSEIMSKMAMAAQEGGAGGIRANSPEDIRAIAGVVNLPIIGLWKRNYPDSEVYITPTYADAAVIAEAGASIVAMDATLRHRPNGERLEEIVQKMKKQYSCLLMADISTLEEGVYANSIGFDMVSTTLSGYTSYSTKGEAPDSKLVEELAGRLSIPTFAEGRIHTPEQARQMINLGAHAVVIGGAITRPQSITKRFADSIHCQQFPIQS